MNTAPPPTAGVDSPNSAPVLYFHFVLPVAMSMATKSPFPAPIYATPPAITGEDSNDSPPSQVQSSFRFSGGKVPVAIPVSDALPRNCGQSAKTGNVNKTARVRKRIDTTPGPRRRQRA